MRGLRFELEHLEVRRGGVARTRLISVALLNTLNRSVMNCRLPRPPNLAIPRPAQVEVPQVVEADACRAPAKPGSRRAITAERGVAVDRERRTLLAEQVAGDFHVPAELVRAVHVEVPPLVDEHVARAAAAAARRHWPPLLSGKMSLRVGLPFSLTGTMAS